MQVSLKELDASTKRYTDWKAREKKSPELESVIPKAKNAIPPKCRPGAPRLRF
jgi:hypothetical protein